MKVFIRGVMMEKNSPNPEEILALYERDRWDNKVPVLDEAAQLAVRDYFRELEMMPAACSLPRASEGYTIDTVLSFNGHARAELINHATTTKVGPYFLGDTYYPEGVAVWRVKQPKPVDIQN